MGKWEIETWNKKIWKNTKREQITTYKRLVKRDKKGKFISIAKIQTKAYGSGYYDVGISKGKIVTRKKIAEKNIMWYNRRKEVMSKKEIFRVQIVLNDAVTNQIEIPYRGNNYYGFRLIAFHTKHELLVNLKEKFKDRLIKFIEDCLKYKEDEWCWFDAYYGYEGFKNKVRSYTFTNDIGCYYLQWTKRYGTIKKEECHKIKELY